MATPRRAAEVDDQIATEISTAAPRRGAAPKLPIRRFIAPLAIAGTIMAASAWAVNADEQALDAVPQPSPSVSHTERTGSSVSRSNERPKIEVVAQHAPEVKGQASAAAMPAVEAAETTPEATETPEPTPTPTPTPSKELPGLGKDVDTKWTSASVNIRSGPGTEYDVVRSYGSGSKVTTTSETDGNWQQINLRGEAAWINSKYLTSEQPASSSSRSSSQSSDGGSSSGGTSQASCSRAASVESGLTQRTIGVLRAVCNAFPNVKSFGGYRSGGGSYHSSGRAIDVMISGEAGWEVARWARANASELGITEVIYAQKIWTTQRASEGWRAMSDRGSTSANHYDHVHISVR